jgi:hypothetical protein
MDSALHFFGIRHHGPGCARSLLQALEQLQPDCLLIEGPPEGEALLPMLQHADLQPPVAMLVYVQDSPAHAAFYPYAEFSPEWQALQWAARQGVATRFIDLPQTHRMALDMAEQERRKAEAQESAASDADGEEAHVSDEGLDTDAAEGAALHSSAVDALDRDDTAPQAVPAADLATGPAAPGKPDWRDPLDLLAEAAGYPDGESWWNRMVEERGDGATLFEGIAEAMAVVRAELPNEVRGERHARREALREAWMRQCMREAIKAGHQRIAVVCGAWHVPALQAQVTAKADAATLRACPRPRSRPPGRPGPTATCARPAATARAWIRRAGTSTCGAVPSPCRIPIRHAAAPGAPSDGWRASPICCAPGTWTAPAPTSSRPRAWPKAWRPCAATPARACPNWTSPLSPSSAWASVRRCA